MNRLSGRGSRHRAALILALSVLMGTACTSTSPAPASTPEPPGGEIAPIQHTLRLGHFPNFTHATAIVGVEAGLFAKYLAPDVDLQVVTFNAGPAAVEALFAGGLDATYVGPNPTLDAYVRSRGEAVRVIAGATSGGAALVVRPGITGAQDLVGKRVGTPQLGNTQDVALRTWLQSQGLRTEATGAGDVSVVPQDNAQALESFRSGQIDAAWLPEPWASRMVVEAGGRVLVDERSLWPGGEFATANLIVRAELLRDQPALIERLLRGHAEATRYLNERPEEALQMVDQGLRRSTGQSMPPEVLARAWGNLSFINDPIASSLRKSANDAAALGFLNLSGVSLDGIYDLRPLNKVLQETGQTEVTIE
jgi:NitT/TauT family transport system substrate-binding protein